MCCAICGQDVHPGEASVATTEGATVHVTCADREARVAWLRRRRWAVMHALAGAGAVGGLPWVSPKPWLLALIGIGVITHPLIHRRVWHSLVHAVRTWLRR